VCGEASISSLSLQVLAHLLAGLGGSGVDAQGRTAPGAKLGLELEDLIQSLT